MYTRIRRERKASFSAARWAGTERTATPPAPPSSERTSIGFGVPIHVGHVSRTGLSLQRSPVLQQIRAPAVNLEPRQRLGEDMTMEHGALGAEGGAQIVQPRLQREDLMQPLDVAARNRQQAQLDLALE